VLIGGLTLFSLAGLLSAFTQGFSMLLLARFVQGVGAGAPRVVAFSLARDSYSGPQLGRVLSLAVMLFMAAPILAPSLGQLILLVAPWRWVFGALVLGGGILLVWALLRLEETLPVERRRSISPRAVLESFRITITTRAAVGYTLALGLVMGSQMGFVISAQRIFMDIFDTGGSFTLLFALVALAMSVAAFTNSRLVLRFGMRHLVVVGLGALILLNTAHLALVWLDTESLTVFMLMQSGSMFIFGFLGANLNTLAIEPLGHVAGTGSSAIGFFTTVCGALLGFGIGQLFDGSVVPLTLAYVVLGLTALTMVVLAERR
jgi:DHA1 family bicyclomycin/chloramphenicol resistance-like MFS transporter